MTARIGNCSGFYGDRLSAMREMLEGGQLDYLTGDYLAELTMLILGRDAARDESLGYARTFLRQMQDCLGLVVDRGVRVVSNAGGLNPAGLAARVREIAADQRLAVSVAHVEGDDLKARVDELGLSRGESPPLTANAYLGAFGIAAAFDAGADIVVTGRVTDASVTVGPAIAQHGWARDDFDRLAGAVTAGHVIECGAQATGGNYSGFTMLDRAGMRHVGFPIAEVDADGGCVITKHEGTGGAVMVDTVTAQLVYEIGSPAYPGPDVVAHLDSARLEQVGPDRVSISGVRGSAPPPELKVCLNALGGYRNSVEFVLTGLDVDAKAALVREQMEAVLASGDAGPPEVVEWRLDLPQEDGADDPATQAAATSLLRCHVKSAAPEPVGRAFSGAAVELALASYPGFSLTRPPAAGAPYGVYTEAYVDQAAVPHVAVLGDGTRIEIPPPPSAPGSSAPLERVQGAPAPTEDRRDVTGHAGTVRAPLGTIAYARSGDKGGDANVGVWIPGDRPEADRSYAWLTDLLAPERVQELIPEAADLDVEVHPLPNLRAVNVVVHGLLGEGVAASTRADPQAKALGEWLRARHVDVPTAIATTSSKPSAMTPGRDDATEAKPGGLR